MRQIASTVAVFIALLVVAARIRGMGKGAVPTAHKEIPTGTRHSFVDENEPGEVARLFAPGIVSRPREEGSYAERPVFSLDGRECYFDVNNYSNRTFTSFSMRYQNGKWTRPEPAFFARYRGHQASLSADGSLLFFVAPSSRESKIEGIWMAKRVGDNWAEPEFLNAPVNDGSDARFPCVARSGSLYYLCAVNKDKPSRFGVCRTSLTNGRPQSMKRITALQSRDDVVMGDFYVAPDESYIVIYSTLKDDLGQGDLYVSFRQADNTWTDLRNLGPAVNTKGYDFAPSISPDGRFLFFTRDRGDKQGDVYWISSDVVRKLRPAGNLH